MYGKLEEIKLTIKNKDIFLPLDLQFFAEDPPSDPPVDDPEDPEGGDNKTFTQSELDSQISKAVDSALKKQQSKLESDIEKRIEDAKKETERLAKLSEKERKDEELIKREKELTERLGELERKELKADAASDLSEKGLPTSFADFLLAEDAEKTLANINDFKTSFDEAVNQRVKEALRQDTPKLGSKKLQDTNNVSKAEMARKNRIL